MIPEGYAGFLVINQLAKSYFRLRREISSLRTFIFRMCIHRPRVATNKPGPLNIVEVTQPNAACDSCVVALRSS